MDGSHQRRHQLFTLVSILMVVVTIALGQGSPAPAWASSIEAFLTDLGTWQAPRPAATFIGLGNGQLVSDNWEIMKKYRGTTITWEATFEGVTRDTLLVSDSGRESKEMDKLIATFPAKGFRVAVHAYVSARHCPNG